MQIPPGDAFSRNVSGSVAQPGTTPRQVPSPQIQTRQQARTAPTEPRPDITQNSPPPVARAHSVERIAQADVPRDMPRGSLINIEV